MWSQPLPAPTVVRKLRLLSIRSPLKVDKGESYAPMRCQASTATGNNGLQSRWESLPFMAALWVSFDEGGSRSGQDLDGNVRTAGQIGIVGQKRPTAVFDCRG